MFGAAKSYSIHHFFGYLNHDYLILILILFPYLLYENPLFIIVSAETEYFLTRSWYRNINFFQSGINLSSIKCSENRLGSTVPFCLFDRVLNVISILAGLFSNPETVKMLNQNGMLDCTVVGKHTRRGGYPHNFACTI
jgi:hypothetical protein